MDLGVIETFFFKFSRADQGKVKQQIHSTITAQRKAGKLSLGVADTSFL